MFAQVVHAGLWTGYLDGIGVGGINVRNLLYLDPEFAAQCPECRAEVFSVAGNLLQSLPAPLPVLIDFWQWLAGVYVLHVYAGKKMALCVDFSYNLVVDRKFASTKITGALA